MPFSHESMDISLAITELVGHKDDLKADAILFSTSKLGLNGIECISALGLKIPEDIAIVSFDNADAYTICFSPVTVVAQPLQEIGKKAVNIILDKINNPTGSPKFQQYTLKTEFIVRKSCGY